MADHRVGKLDGKALLVSLPLLTSGRSSHSTGAPKEEISKNVYMFLEYRARAGTGVLPRFLERQPRSAPSTGARHKVVPEHTKRLQKYTLSGAH